jgi:hypothetical protein
MTNIMPSAMNRITDVRSFLKSAASSASIKYRPERNERHHIYIPYNIVPVEDEATGKRIEEKQIIAIAGGVHEWVDSNDRYHATVCMKDNIRNADGVVINDGTCSICDRIQDGWDIYNYRMEMEKERCGKTGEDLKKHLDNMKRHFAMDRKAKEAHPYVYLLIALFKTNAKGDAVLDDEGLPEFSLKVMKLSVSRLQKINDTLENTQSDFAGAEIVFKYPNEEDKRLVVSQSITTPVFPSHMFTMNYPELKERIHAEAAKFNFTGIEKAFQEWKLMSTAEATKAMDAQFVHWDKYKKELVTNPDAKYMEYKWGNSMPELDGVVDKLGNTDLDRVFGDGGLSID